MALASEFATPAQMEERSQGAIPATQPFLEMALKAATREIRKVCGWHIAEEVTETVFLDDAAGPILALPSRLVSAVTSVKVNGVDTSVSSFLWLRDGRLAKPYYVPYYRVAEVTLTHGYAQVPEDLADMTLQIAARALGSPLGLTREQAGGVSVTMSLTAAGVAGGTVVLEHERESLAEYMLGWSP